jgi:translation initiation factor IF-2
VKVQLLSEGLELEEYGGDVQLVETAARKGQGLDALEEALLLQVRLLFM